MTTRSVFLSDLMVFCYILIIFNIACLKPLINETHTRTKIGWKTCLGWINFILKLFDILNIKFFNINLTGQSYSCTYPTTLFLHKSSFYCQPNAVILVTFFSSIYFLIHILILKSAFPDPHTLIIIPSSSIPHLRNLILEPSFSNTHPLILFLRFTYLNFSLP